MNYELLMQSVPEGKLEQVKLNNGEIIECKKVPLSALDSMDTFLGGMKDALSFADKGLGFVATCGKTQLFSAVGDVSSYMKNSKGDFLSATKGSNGKITGQPGFQMSGVAQEGMNAAVGFAKALPWIGLAVMVIEVGTKIVLHQREIKANQIAVYDKYRETIEDHATDLWTAVNDYTILIADDATRSAYMNKIIDAFNDANRIFAKLNNEVQNSKKINDHLVYAMKGALELYSFSYLLKIMYSKTDCIDYVKKASSEIAERQEIYNQIAERCYSQYTLSQEKHNKALMATQMQNDKLDKKTLGFRALADIATGGIAELVSLGSKGIGKQLNKNDATILANLEKCKVATNPYAECIENVCCLIANSQSIFRDDKYLYYRA